MKNFNPLKKKTTGQKPLLKSLTLLLAMILYLGLLPEKAFAAPSGDLAGLKAAAANGGAYTLTGNIFTDETYLAAGLVVENDLTIDLAGFTLEINLANPTSVGANGIKIMSGVTLTIMDSAGGGALKVNLENNNTSSWGNHAGINTAEGKFVINSGEVTATGCQGGAGIGGGEGIAGGILEINGGTVTATSRDNGAGIGGGGGGGGGTVTINGGTVTANGGFSHGGGAGIGGGGTSGGTAGGSGTITITTDGTVTATGGSNGANIGAGGGSGINAGAEYYSISISAHPVPTTTVTQGSISGNLTAAATVLHGGTPFYQWYSNTTNSNAGGTAISGATSASFTIPITLTTGTYYYFCEVTTEPNYNSPPQRSNVATVTVNPVPAYL
jgi:hypothetical protein